MLGVKRRQDFAISTAVSVLSPVRTQNRIDAALMETMASGTPSCSLSSMAVIPAGSKECSTSAAISASFFSRSSDSRLASFQRLSQSSVKLRSIFFAAITRVRRPSLEYCVKLSPSVPSSGREHKGPMMLSAPLHMHQYSPTCFTITLMRFLSEVKGISQTFVKVNSCGPGPFTTSSVWLVPASRVREAKVTPTALAASTKATSSAELPSKIFFPFAPVSTCTEWLVARFRKNQSAWECSGSAGSARTLFASATPTASSCISSFPPLRKSPRSFPPTQQCAKTISFSVRVPVLSENTKFT
mmetsp:Transcript_117746/g.279550  ORF Transcript_117746/g.279550 Transcript_117746/m.279550 type:complete len:300 (+) Transcript_117746:1288-2187(+)